MTRRPAPPQREPRHVSFVDGMWIVAPLPIDAPTDLPPGRKPDWTIALGRRSPGVDLDGVEWTGDVRGSEGVWARFGRRDAMRFVCLAGVAELRAAPGVRTAFLRHDRGPAWDLPALRRTSPYLASLLGRTALHAATVVLPRGAVVLCAHSGVGKSTLALTLDRQGFPVLGDDHVVLDPSASVGVGACASFPFVDVDTRPLPGMGGAAGGKGSAPLRTPRPREAVPVVEVAFLERGDRVLREPLPAPEALARLLRDFVFVADPADDEAQVARLDVCLRLLAAAPPVRWIVPSGIERLGEAVAGVVG